MQIRISGPDLEFLPFFPVLGKTTKLGTTGQKNSGRSHFSYNWTGDGIFFPVKERSGENLHLTLQREADSMLAVLCSGLFADEEDTNGYLFIDRDFTHFNMVLTYLREGPAVAQTIVEESIKGPLSRELRYYGLLGLTKPLIIPPLS